MLLTLTSLMEIGCWMGHHACLVLRISWLWSYSSRIVDILVIVARTMMKFNAKFLRTLTES